MVLLPPPAPTRFNAPMTDAHTAAVPAGGDPPAAAAGPAPETAAAPSDLCANPPRAPRIPATPRNAGEEGAGGAPGGPRATGAGNPGRARPPRARRIPAMPRNGAPPANAPKARTSWVRGRPRPHVCARRGVGREARGGALLMAAFGPADPRNAPQRRPARERAEGADFLGARASPPARLRAVRCRQGGARRRPGVLPARRPGLPVRTIRESGELYRSRPAGPSVINAAAAEPGGGGCARG